MKTTYTFLLLIIPFLGFAQVGIGTTNPNPDALLDVYSTAGNPGGILLPKMGLTSTSDSTPLTSHVEGMLIYNTAITADVTPGFYINKDAQWTRVEDLSPVASASSLSGDQEISSSSYAAVPGMNDVTFTARKTEVLVQLTASGFGYTNSMSLVGLQVYNSTTSQVVGGSVNKIQSYDDVTGTITTWSMSFSKMLTGLTIGTSYTLQVQGMVTSIHGISNAVIYETTYPESCHLTLSVLH